MKKIMMMIIVLLLSSVGAYGMQQKERPRPYAVVPQYIYQNPTQFKSYDWNADTFAKLKSTVGNLTMEKLREQNPSKSPEELLRLAEHYDWIYAMTYLETLLKKPYTLMTIEDIKKLNAYLMRLTGTGTGSFRTDDKAWSKYHLSSEEFVFFKLIDMPSWGGAY